MIKSFKIWQTFEQNSFQTWNFTSIRAIFIGSVYYLKERGQSIIFWLVVTASLSANQRRGRIQNDGGKFSFLINKNTSAARFIDLTERTTFSAIHDGQLSDAGAEKIWTDRRPQKTDDRRSKWSVSFCSWHFKNHFTNYKCYAIKLLLSESVNQELQKKIQEAFEVFDHEHNNTVDVREIGTIIRSLGQDSNLRSPIFNLNKNVSLWL